MTTISVPVPLEQEKFLKDYIKSGRAENKAQVFRRALREFQENEAVFSIPSGELLEGSLPAGKMKLVVAWIELHRDELMADWELAASGQHPYKIEPLR